MRKVDWSEKVSPEPNSGCWLWLGGVNVSGYGRCKLIAGATSAHRAVWMDLVGPIPQGMVLDHICRVRSCVNPDHLRVATPRQNALENSLSTSARNAERTNCYRCAGPYQVRKRDGARICPACVRNQCVINQRAYRARKRARKIAALSQPTNA